MKRALAFAAILAALLLVSSGMRRTTDLSALLPSDGELSAAAAAISTAAGTVVLEVDGTG
ncbi:MAG: hypothetical protein H0V89_06670, partial [Deltaproteobacteria bacterium]|nr:hypothetical protein [Deltaproteobacteria bacterium]